MKPALLALSGLLALASAACTGEAGSSVEAAPASSAPSPPSIGAADRPETGAELVPTNPSERALQSYVDGLDEVVSALRLVEDEASTDAATDAIRRVGERWRKEETVWSDLDADEYGAAHQRYAAEIGRLQGQMMQSLTGLMRTPELAARLREAIQALPKPSELR